MAAESISPQDTQSIPSEWVRQDCPWCEAPDAVHLRRQRNTTWRCSSCGVFTLLPDGEALFHTWLAVDPYGWNLLRIRMKELLGRTAGGLMITSDLMVRVKYGLRRA